MLRLFPSLHGYQRPWLRRDVVAGLTMWAVLVPEALAYATIAGVSSVVGLYAAPGALILYAALGSSMAATAALSAATVADLVPVGDNRFAAFTAGLALATGLAALVAGVLRLGFLANYISEPVLKGVHRRPRVDNHRRPAPQAARHHQGQRRLLRAGLAHRHPPRPKRTPSPCSSASRRSPSSSDSGAPRRASPVRWLPLRSASPPSRCSTPTSRSSDISTADYRHSGFQTSAGTTPAPWPPGASA